MADRNPQQRANLGEQTNNDVNAASADGSEIDRQDATSERDAEIGRSMRESSKQSAEQGQSNDRQQGRESTDNSGGSFGGQGGQKGGTTQREGAADPEGTGYTSDQGKKK